MNENNFGGGRVILLDPSVSVDGWSAQVIVDGNAAWVDRLMRIVEERRAPLRLVKSTAEEGSES